MKSAEPVQVRNLNKLEPLAAAMLAVIVVYIVVLTESFLQAALISIALYAAIGGALYVFSFVVPKVDAGRFQYRAVLLTVCMAIPLVVQVISPY